jgi:hypothetical protein
MAIPRGHKIKTGTDLLRLALAHGPGGISLRDAAGWAKLVKVPSAQPMEYQMRAEC